MPHDPVLDLDFENSATVQNNCNAEVIRKKQKTILLYKVLGISLLVSIPLVINVLSRLNHQAWETPVAVGILGLAALMLYRVQIRLRTQIETACYQLGPGVKLRKKYTKNKEGYYLIFQEGHRYYHIRSLSTGEKRLVPKEKVLEDYELMVSAS